MRVISFLCVAIFSLFALFSFCTYAQVSSGGIPLTLKFPSEFAESVFSNSIIHLPNVDNDMEQKKAKEITSSNCSTDCNDQYYGKGLDLATNIKTHGQQQTIKDIGKVWLLKVESSNAFGMQFYFDKFNLPDGATLFFYNESKTMILGAFTSSNNPKVKGNAIEFGTQFISGNSIIVEYFEPSNVDFEGELSIIKVIHIFKDIFAKSGPFSGLVGNCHINASCPEGSGWEAEINSVALILAYNSSNNLTYRCSGALINNTEQNGRALFLTAKHCTKDSQGTNDPKYNPSNWIFLFNHQTEKCDSDGSEISNSTTQSVFGSNVLAEDEEGSPNSDYLLLDLITSESVLADYGACYAGWSLTTSPEPPFTGIHHPKGDVKKISIDQDETISVSFFGSSTESEFGDHWMINWDKGATEFGSSGSPLFDKNHKIIGQLGGGFSGCNGTNNNGKADWYGKFSKSWDLGDFSFYLDPFSTGKTFVSAYCPAGFNGGGNNNGGGLYGPTVCGTNKFDINGISEGIAEVCLNEQIVISATPSSDEKCEYTSLRTNVSYKKLKCSEVEDYAIGCSSPIFEPKKCVCHYSQIFISVIECDYNLNYSSQEYFQWFYLDEEADFVFSNSSPQLISFKLNNYLPNGLILQENKTYRLKLARTTSSGWQEEVRYFRTYSDNRYIKNTTIVGNVHAKTITLESVIVEDNGISIVANDMITILPNSNLQSGNYIIEDVSCDNLSAYRINTGIMASNYEHEITEEKSHNITDKRAISSGIIDIEKENINIYPNPTNGTFTIDLGPPQEFKVSVMNQLGVEVFNKSDNNSISSVNINEFPDGLYFLMIKTENQTIVKKVLKY